MRVIKFLIIILLFCTNCYSQDSSWRSFELNNLLTISAPKNVKLDEQGYIKVYMGEVNGCYIVSAYYDKLVKVENAEDFRIGLSAFAYGFTKKVSKDQYQIIYSDTSIGNTKGILTRYIAKDTSVYAKTIISYATMANSHFYTFQFVNPAFVGNKDLEEKYFNSIRFDPNKIIESKYLINSVLIKRD